MIKQTFILGANLNPDVAKKNKIEADRNYFRYHSKEVARVLGPWLRRYESFPAYNAPPEADRFGVQRWRLTEAWVDSIEALQEAFGLRPLLTGYVYENPPAGTQINFPAVPTEFFVDNRFEPEEKPFMRWIRGFRYPDGVSKEEGEKWYLEKFSQEVKTQPGLLRYMGFKAIIEPKDYSLMRYHRLEELWYPDTGAYWGDFSAWRKANIESPPKYTPPPWGGKEPWVIMESIFVPFKPDVNFLKDDATIP